VNPKLGLLGEEPTSIPVVDCISVKTSGRFERTLTHLFRHD